MKVIFRFLDNGVPKTGLSPTLDIYDVETDTSLFTSEPMQESSAGGGRYIFDFTKDDGFDALKDYVFDADGTSTLGDSDRYLSANWQGFLTLTEFFGNTGGGGGVVFEKFELSEEDFKKLESVIQKALSNIQVRGNDGELKTVIAEMKKVKQSIDDVKKAAIGAIKKEMEKREIKGLDLKKVLDAIEKQDIRTKEEIEDVIEELEVLIKKDADSSGNKMLKVLKKFHETL